MGLKAEVDNPGRAAGVTYCGQSHTPTALTTHHYFKRTRVTTADMGSTVDKEGFGWMIKYGTQRVNWNQVQTTILIKHISLHFSLDLSCLVTQNTTSTSLHTICNRLLKTFINSWTNDTTHVPIHADKLGSFLYNHFYSLTVKKLYKGNLERRDSSSFVSCQQTTNNTDNVELNKQASVT